MSSKLQIRWIMAGCVWLAAFGLTYYNYGKIDSVALARQANEQLRKEIAFQCQHAKRLEQVAAARKTLFLGVASVDLGLIVVRSQIASLAADFDLDDMQMSTEMNLDATEVVPCTLTLQGGFENIVGFLAALHQHTYLTVDHSNILVSTERNKVDVKLALSVHYKITAPEIISDHLPQVSHRQADLEANPL